jgi:hypothetical protein
MQQTDIDAATLLTFSMQDELEAALFSILKSKGYGEEYEQRFQMVSTFYQQQRPLVILICGSACTGGWWG